MGFLTQHDRFKSWHLQNYLKKFIDCATTQVVSLRTLAAEVQVQSQATLRGQSGTGTGCAPNTSVLHCQYNYTKFSHSFLN